MLNKGDKIGLICCSNGKSLSDKPSIEKLIRTLKQTFQVQPVLAPTIYQSGKSGHSSASAEKRAAALMDFYTDPSIKIIFDLSGGDLANEILPYLNYDVIKNSGKPFVGHSDLTVILNALYTKSDIAGYHYQLLNMSNEEKQMKFFSQAFMHPSFSVELNYHWLTAAKNSTAPIIGGNIRCFLKLAGTPYWPDPKGKILLLEAYSGEIEQIKSYFAQLDQIGVFYSCEAFLLGQFTQIEKAGQQALLEEMVLNYARHYSKPAAKTPDIGHSADSVPLPIGAMFSLF